MVRFARAESVLAVFASRLAAVLSSVATSASTANYGYDASDNLTNLNGHSLSYDAADELATYDNVTNFTYDNRIGRKMRTTFKARELPPAAVRKLVEIDLVDKDGAADQIDAEPEAALAVLILVVGTRNEAGRHQQHVGTHQRHFNASGRLFRHRLE